MAGEDLFVPPPPMGPLDLGLPDPPQAPQVPAFGAPPEDFKQKLMRLIAVGVAGGLGPGAGTGILQGLHASDQQKARDQQLKDQQNRFLYTEQQNQYEAQRRLYEQDVDQRQRTLQANLDRLRQVAPTLKTKADYDRYIDAYANGLQGLGLRINGNWLRTAVPYVAPKAKDEAAKVLEAFYKNPANKSLLEEHPDQLSTVKLRFDRDGDGVPEDVPFLDVATIAEMPLAQDADGTLLVYPKGTRADDKANADGIFQTLLEQAKAEGKALTPALKMQLQQEAIKKAKEAGDLGPDPTLEAIRQLTLSQAKNAPKPTYPTHVQKRIDALAKGFDLQQGVKRVQIMAEAVSFADSMDINTKSPSDDQALIYAFAKAMDPDSVVREGEYATVQKYAQSWAESFGFTAARIFSNTAFLTPQARQNMKNTIRAKFSAGRGQYQNLRNSYAAKIDRITGQSGSGELELIDYGGAFPSEPTPEAVPTPETARSKYRSRQGVK